MGRRKATPDKPGKVYKTVGLDPEELQVIGDVMDFYRCGLSAAVRLLIRSGAPALREAIATARSRS